MTSDIAPNRHVNALSSLTAAIHACRHCADKLPLGPRPVVRLNTKARVLLIGQAPGTKVHATGIPWNDASGENLRRWLGLPAPTFYDVEKVAIMPMGFCYPGSGKSGDKPPRPECAPLWHARVTALLPNIELIILIGSYAIKHYLPSAIGESISELVRRTDIPSTSLIPVVHPSPRNRRWLAQNPWFERTYLPALRLRVFGVIEPAAR